MEIVLAIIKNGDKVLIGKVKADKISDFGELAFSFPSGQVEDGEDPEAAICREVLEETNLTVTNPKLIGSRIHPSTGKQVNYYFFITNVSDVKVNPSVNDDLDKLFWVEIDKLEEYMPTLNPEVKNFLSGV